jgi:hypothetical protein
MYERQLARLKRVVDAGNASASRQRHLPVERTADQKKTQFSNVVFKNDYFPSPNLFNFIKKFEAILSFTRTRKLKTAAYLYFYFIPIFISIPTSL